MYCTSCGTARTDLAANVCPSCGQRIRRFPAPTPISNYLVQSILVTLCCCAPLGIVALVYASQVNTKLAAGDMAGAQLSAKKAKTWMWIGFALGAVIGAGYTLTLLRGA